MDDRVEVGVFALAGARFRDVVPIMPRRSRRTDHAVPITPYRSRRTDHAAPITPRRSRRADRAVSIMLGGDLPDAFDRRRNRFGRRVSCADARIGGRAGRRCGGAPERAAADR
jgi:hypothetical protein